MSSGPSLQLDVGAPVLLDEQTGGGVPHEERQQALPDAGAVHDVRHLTGDFDQAAPEGLDDDARLVLSHGRRVADECG
jgi:hypothetical protein